MGISDKNLKNHLVQPPLFTDEKTEATPLAPQKTRVTKNNGLHQSAGSKY